MGEADLRRLGDLRFIGGTALGRYGFTGAEMDITTGYFHMGARFYDPTIGRWLSEDPVQDKPFDPATLNVYAYANLNPLAFTDPDGKAAILVIVGAAVVGFGLGIGAYLGSHQGSASLGGALAWGAAGAAATVTATIATLSIGSALAPSGVLGSLALTSGEKVVNFVTSTGARLQIQANLVINGTTLEVRGVSIFSADGSKVAVGTKEFLALARELAQRAKAAGFDTLVITGVRVSGANPGRQVHIVIDLLDHLP